MSDTAPDPVAQQQHLWTIGDYPTIARHLLPISVDTVAALEVGSGDRVLDVGVGDGNAAILAAQRGAVVTGLDLTPAQIERARARCAAEGVSVDLRVGDAQALDVEDGAFDVVLSVMGVIFAPDHAAAMAEMARACRPGGRVGFTAWTDAGWFGAWRERVADLLPPATPGPLPDDWGDPDEVRRRTAAAGLTADVEERPFAWTFPSPDAAFETFTTAAGPFVAFMELMESLDQADEARTRLLDVLQASNDATDGTCRLSASYLLVTATR